MALRALLIATAVFGCCFSGCAKKSKISHNQGNQIPTVSATAKPDTQNVFDEFYKDTGAPEPERGNAKTFSMNAPDSYTPHFSKRGRYTVQISSMASRWLAEELATQFKERGFPAYVSEIQDPTDYLSGTYFRVRIGGFITIEDAKAFGENVLKPANYNYWIDRKARDKAVSKSPAGSSSVTPSAPADNPASAAAPSPEPAIPPTPAASSPQTAAEISSPPPSARIPDSTTTDTGTTSSGWQNNSLEW